MVKTEEKIMGKERKIPGEEVKTEIKEFKEYNFDQRKMIRKNMVGGTIMNLEYNGEEKYWTMEIHNKNRKMETNFRFMPEIWQ